MIEQPADNGQLIVLTKPKRKNSDRASGWRNLTDVLFGVIAPILCLIFDPIVFRGVFSSHSGLPTPWTQQWRVFAYLSIGLGIAIFTNWLWHGRQSSKLPISIITLGIGVGWLGFIPFATSFVYLRNAKDAARLAQEQLVVKPLAFQFVSGIGLVVIIPLAAQFATTAYSRSAVDDILHSNSMAEAQPAIERLDRAIWCDMECYQPITWEIVTNENPDRQAYLGAIFTHFRLQLDLGDLGARSRPRGD